MQNEMWDLKWSSDIETLGKRKNTKVDKSTWIKYDKQKLNSLHLFGVMLSFCPVVITCSLPGITTCPVKLFQVHCKCLVLISVHFYARVSLLVYTFPIKCHFCFLVIYRKHADDESRFLVVYRKHIEDDQISSKERDQSEPFQLAHTYHGKSFFV